MFLLDINVLIALVDPSHVHHDRAQRWFHTERVGAWATCPLTENGFVRIVGNPNYATVSGGTETIRLLLQKICALPGHQFWPDDLSLTNTKTFPKLAGSSSVTDLYLLALAVSRSGSLATLDARIDPNLVAGGPASYQPIPK